MKVRLHEAINRGRARRAITVLVAAAVLAIFLACTSGTTSTTAGPGFRTFISTPTPRPTLRVEHHQHGQHGYGLHAQHPKVRDRVIVLDPGHGGWDTGAVHHRANGSVDLTEATVNLEIAKSTAQELRHDGFVVFLTRTSNKAVNVPPVDYNKDGVVDSVDELEARIAFAKHHRASIFVSMHINGGTPNNRGLTVYYCPAHSFWRANRRLAQDLDLSIYQRLRTIGYDPPNMGVQTDVADKVPQRYADYPYFLQLGPANSKDGLMSNPAVSALGETLYITNDPEDRLLHQSKTIHAIATGYAKGIERYTRR